MRELLAFALALVAIVFIGTWMTGLPARPLSISVPVSSGVA